MFGDNDLGKVKDLIPFIILDLPPFALILSTDLTAIYQKAFDRLLHDFKAEKELEE